MRVIVKTMIGKNYTFLLQANEKGIDLKKRIEEVDGTYRDNITLVSNGKILENEDVLEDIGISDGSTIHYLTKFVSCSCTPCKSGARHG
jgi:hypothetical protein